MLLLAVLGVGLAGCGSGSNGDAPRSGRIEGKVVYLERLQLPPGATVQVQLEDISRPDAMATLLQEVELSADQGPPYPFVIEYQDLATDRRGHYALKAAISLAEQRLFTSTDYVDPFAASPVEIRVHPVPEQVPSP